MKPDPTFNSEDCTIKGSDGQWHKVPEPVLIAFMTTTALSAPVLEQQVRADERAKVEAEYATPSDRAPYANLIRANQTRRIVDDLRARGGSYAVIANLIEREFSAAPAPDDDQREPA